jgi:hypothetical protein
MEAPAGKSCEQGQTGASSSTCLPDASDWRLSIVAEPRLYAKPEQPGGWLVAAGSGGTVLMRVHNNYYAPRERLSHTAQGKRKRFCDGNATVPGRSRS